MITNSFLTLKFQSFTKPVVENNDTMSSAEEKKLLLKSSDGEIFQMEEAVAMQFEKIREMIEDKGAGNDEIFFPNVKGSVLLKVIEYCNRHVKAREDDLKSWDKDFVKVDKQTLLDLIVAANNLKIKSLVDLTCGTVADMIKGKTPAEIRRFFNIKDCTPEEEEEFEGELLVI